MEQLTLPVTAIQPTEAFLVYRIIIETYDRWQTEHDNDENSFGWPAPRTLYRATSSNEKLEGVVTDDHSYRIMEARFEKFASKLAQELITDNEQSKKYENYQVKVTYEFRKTKHIVMKTTTTE